MGIKGNILGRTCGFNEIQRLHSFQGPRQHLKPNTGRNLTYSSLLIYNSGFTLVTFFSHFSVDLCSLRNRRTKQRDVSQSIRAKTGIIALLHSSKLASYGMVLITRFLHIWMISGIFLVRVRTGKFQHNLIPNM